MWRIWNILTCLPAKWRWAMPTFIPFIARSLPSLWNLCIFTSQEIEEINIVYSTLKGLGILFNDFFVELQNPRILEAYTCVDVYMFILYTYILLFNSIKSLVNHSIIYQTTLARPRHIVLLPLGLKLLKGCPHRIFPCNIQGPIRRHESCNA